MIEKQFTIENSMGISFIMIEKQLTNENSRLTIDCSEKLPTVQLLFTTDGCDKAESFAFNAQ